MSDDEWKQSAVMFYAFGTIIALVIFVALCIFTMYKNRDRRMRIRKFFCWCCTRDVMSHYDTINRQDDDEQVVDGLLDVGREDAKFTITDEEDDDDEIEVDVGIDIHGSPPMRTLEALSIGYKDEAI